MNAQKAACDVFISYSRKDKVFVRKLVDHLQNFKRTAWVDWQDIMPLSQWREEIQDGVLLADSFLFILSPDSLISQECLKELEWAVENNKRLVPIVCRSIKGCTVPKPLADVNWIFFEGKDFNQCFQDLLEALDINIAHVKTHTRLLTRAREWDSRQRDSSLLLRGTNLEVHEDWLAQTSECQPRPTQLQLDYVAKSRVAETQRYRKEMRNQRIALGSVISALIVVATLGFFAEVQRREAITNEIRALNYASASSMTLDRPFEAMIQALKANIRQQKANWINQPLASETLSNLSQAAYQIQERNRLAGHNDWVYGVEFLPVENSSREKQGLLLASGSLDGTVKLWNLNGQNLDTFQPSGGGKIANIALSPDGQQIASVGEDTFVRLWDLDGNLLNTFKGHEAWIYGVAFSPNGELIASGSVDNTVRLWNQDGSLVSLMRGHSNMVLNVAFDPNGSTIASGSFDGTLRIWQTDGTLVKTIDNGAQIYDVGFSPDGQFIASTDENGLIKFWQADGAPIETFKGGDNALRSLDFSPNSQLIAAAGVDGVINLWRTDGSLVTTLTGHQDDIQSVTFSPDGSLLASASRDLEIRLWQWDNPWLEVLKGHTGAVTALAINPQTQGIISVSQNGELTLWNEASDVRETVTTTIDTVNTVAVSSDGQWIAIAGEKLEDTPVGLVELWTSSGNLKGVLARQKSFINTVAFSPDGNLLASAGNEGKVYIHNLEGQVQQTIDYGHNIFYIDFSSDGQYLAVGGEGSLQIWDLDTQLSTHTYEKIPDTYSVNFSPDGRTLVFANSDRTVGLWQLNDPEPKFLPGHEGEVKAVQFSPTGEQFASAGTDQTIRLWNQDGTPIATIGTHAASVEALAFNYDGSKLISGSDDRTLKIWDVSIVNSETLVKLGCRWLNGYLQNNSLVPEADKNLCQGIDFSDFQIP